MRPIPFNALAKLMGGSHPCQTLVQGVAIDSRKVIPGDLFFALSGNKVDGHTFLKEVSSKGAVGAIVREDFRGEEGGLPLIRVPDVLKALQDLARKTLARRSSQVIAITGSLGKTTTKEFTAALLRTRYRVFSSPLSYNSQATLPLSILMANGDEDYLILEMGMTHAGNIDNLISIAPPDIAMITTVAVQHAINFSDGLAGISREKASIFSQTKTRLGLMHHDVPHYDLVSSTGSCPKKTFSLCSQEANYFLEAIPEGVRVHTRGEESCDCSLNLPIKVHHHNFLAAAALARNLDVPWSLIREAAPLLKLPPMRFEVVEKEGILFINDAYNANPDSIKAALENLPKPKPGGKTIAVLSEMDALGSYSEEGHTLVAQTALQYADHLLCLGSRCESMCAVWSRAQKPVQLFHNRADLGIALKALAGPGDVVLLKGARAYALDQLLTLW
ncbi:UDP-N-acetylmuramoyl-tripeptide--D-alanyl-D-alanine ligase [Chlamydiota bacterium]